MKQQDLDDELKKLARMLDPKAIRDEYRVFKQMHLILCLMADMAIFKGNDAST